jgi:hypothetical protein
LLKIIQDWEGLKKNTRDGTMHPVRKLRSAAAFTPEQNLRFCNKDPGRPKSPWVALMTDCAFVLSFGAFLSAIALAAVDAVKTRQKNGAKKYKKVQRHPQLLHIQFSAYRDSGHGGAKTSAQWCGRGSKKCNQVQQSVSLKHT